VPRRGPRTARDHAQIAQAARTLSRLRGGLAQRLLTVMTAEAPEEKDHLEPGVRLMTLHASKGLEFDRVWIVGCREGSLPSSKSPVPEERRLFYVGMTRAKRFLTLSYVLNKLDRESMFLAEAGVV